MTAIKDFVKVNHHQINYTLPSDFDCDEVELIILPVNNSNSDDKQNNQSDQWEYWSDKEIDNFGKIAIGLSNHNYDDEDYSQW